MAYRPTDPAGTHENPAPEGERQLSGTNPAGIGPNDLAEKHPSLIEEHHVLGPYGEDQIEATDDLGRRWYHLRPEPRSRYDLVGFNYTWWLIWFFIAILIFFPWGPGWGY
jgi:hypothetical protein